MNSATSWVSDRVLAYLPHMHLVSPRSPTAPSTGLCVTGPGPLELDNPRLSVLGSRVGSVAAHIPSPPQLIGHVFAGYFAAAVLGLFTWVSVSSARRLYSAVPTPAPSSTFTAATLDVLPAVVLTVGALAIVGVLRAWPEIGVVHEPARLQATRLATTLLLLVPAIMVTQAVFYLAAGHWALLRGPDGQAVDVAQTAEQLTQTWSLPGLAAGVIVSAAAGLTEEVCGLAIPVWLLVRYRVLDTTRTGHVVAFVAFTVVLRVAYHAYLGPSALAFAPWAALTALLYLRTHRIVPIILAHTLFDVVAFLINPLALPGDWSKFGLLAAILLVPAALWIRRDRRPQTPPAPAAVPNVMAPHLRVRTRSLWRLARSSTAVFGSPLATGRGPLSALYRLPTSTVLWRILHHHRAGIAVHDHAHLVTEQLIPPPPSRTTAATDTILAVVVVATLFAGLLLDLVVDRPLLLIVWTVLWTVAVLAVLLEQHLTRDSETTPRITRAVSTVTALGYRGVVVRADNFTSARKGDGQQLMQRWCDHLDANGVAAVIAARTQRLADRYATFDGFHSVGMDDPLLMYRLPTIDPAPAATL